jgi:hypothetical protein
LEQRGHQQLVAAVVVELIIVTAATEALAS